MYDSFSVVDDLEVGVDPETYQDQTNPAPPLAGNYTVRVAKFSQRTNKEGEIVLTDGKFPVYVIEQIEILEPEEHARKVAIFQDLRFKPFIRNGVPASNVGDFTRACDQTRGWMGIPEGEELVKEFCESQTPFRVQLNWTAYDGDFVKAEFDKLGIPRNQVAKEVSDKIYATAKLKGMKKFPKLLNGKFSHIWVGPSGQAIEARAEITRYYPSLENVNLGPFKV